MFKKNKTKKNLNTDTQENIRYSIPFSRIKKRPQNLKEIFLLFIQGKCKNNLCYNM